MKKILFVCHGNICRSPMAEFVFKKIVEDNKKSEDYHIESAATSSEEIFGNVGNPIYPPVKKILNDLGIDCSNKTARQVNKSDYKKFDLIIGMDFRNIKNMHMIFGSDKDNKIHLLLEFVGQNKEINDPWYSGKFEETYQEILHGCNGLFSYLNN